MPFGLSGIDFPAYREWDVALINTCTPRRGARVSPRLPQKATDLARHFPTVLRRVPTFCEQALCSGRDARVAAGGSS